MRHNVDGILVDIDNVEQMSSAIEKLAHDKKFRESLVKNATQRLKKMFSESAVVDAYLKIFNGEFHDR